MKIKRSMAVILLSLMSMVLIPTFAVALQEDAVLTNAFLHDPLVTSAVFIALLAVVISLVLTCVLVHMRSISCKNTACVHHPRSLGGSGTLDFSLIATPEEFRVYPYEAERAEGSSEVSVDEAILSILANAEGSPQMAREARNIVGADGFDSGEWEVEEPWERPSMEFTDDMISRVLVALEQQQQTAARQHTVAQQQAAAPVLWQASGQRPKVVRPPTGKERSGQQAAIALLVADAAPRGKHFKVAASASGGSEGATIEKFSSHKPAMQGHGKHARVEKTPFRRVS